MPRNAVTGLGKLSNALAGIRYRRPSAGFEASQPPPDRRYTSTLNRAPSPPSVWIRNAGASAGAAATGSTVSASSRLSEENISLICPSVRPPPANPGPCRRRASDVQPPSEEETALPPAGRLHVT